MLTALPPLPPWIVVVLPAFAAMEPMTTVWELALLEVSPICIAVPFVTDPVEPRLIVVALAVPRFQSRTCSIKGAQ